LREVQSGIVFTNGPIFQLFAPQGRGHFEPSKWNLAWRMKPWVSQSK